MLVFVERGKLEYPKKNLDILFERLALATKLFRADI